MLIAPDDLDFVGACFGALKIGAVVVMVDPGLKPDDAAFMLEYIRAKCVVTGPESAAAFGGAARGARAVLVAGSPDLTERLAAATTPPTTFDSHPDDAAIWLFSGGTTGRPKAVVQTSRSFANTTECYARHIIGYRETDVTMSVPKLYFGYATGSNLLFPFAAGAAVHLFAEPATAEVLFEVGTLLRELGRANGRHGLTTLCVGGGMGAAMVLERGTDPRARVLRTRP